jgi:hypothetical protein
MLVPRKMTACNNAGLIGRPKYDPMCLPANSKGKISAHNCKGKSYLCVLSGVATCYVSFFFFFVLRHGCEWGFWKGGGGLDDMRLIL